MEAPREDGSSGWKPIAYGRIWRSPRLYTFDVWECLLSRFRSAMEFAQGGGREAGGEGNELYYHLAKLSSF